MTQHFAPVHSGSQQKYEQSRLTEFDRDLPMLLAPTASSGSHPNGTMNATSETKSDFKIVYVSGGEEVLIDNNEDDRNNNTSPKGSVFAAFFMFLTAIFAKIFHGLNRCRPISAPSRQPEASFSAVEVERLEEELRKMPKKVQKPNAPVY